jgi:hypothetical protein
LTGNTSNPLLSTLCCYSLVAFMVVGLVVFLRSRGKAGLGQVPPGYAAPSTPTSAAQQSDPAPEAIEHFNRAIDMWNNAEESRRDDTLRNDVASELALALKKANAPFPRAYALLAMYLNDLGDDQRAEWHADRALQQNPNEFRAQLVRIDVALKGVKIAKVSAGDVIALGGRPQDAVGETLGRMTGAAIAKTRAGMSQANFKRELERLVQIYRNVCLSNDDVDEYLMMSEALIGLGDFIKDVPMPGGRPNLYVEVVNAPTNNLQITEREQGVTDVRRKAEGRSLLFRPR